ncbi:MAG: hypothetical protein KQH63_01300 [Desulfobulbaceae bacterium]|nr:hypothetical protein [Desulfobulbaceae bacterium]
MTTPQKNEPEACPTSDTNGWLLRVKLLFERSVLACSQIIDFNKSLLDSEEYSAAEQYRFNMMPTEMIVAMNNLRVGMEEALLGLASFGLPTDLKKKGSTLFIKKKDDEKESTDLNQLFQHVVEEGGPEGFLPVANAEIPSDFSVSTEEYQGSLAFLKEMADKYQYYDFENVPKAMEAACRKRNTVCNPFSNTGNQGECGHLQNPEPAGKEGIDPEELRKYQLMCAELIEDANTIYGQFCAVGSIYQALVQE